jgi:hypothetical protein
MRKVIISLCCVVYSALSFAQGLWEMPTCAWTRKMGDRPVFRTAKFYDSPGTKSETLTKKGMSVRGVGTGSFNE